MRYVIFSKILFSIFFVTGDFTLRLLKRIKNVYTHLRLNTNDIGTCVMSGGCILLLLLYYYCVRTYTIHRYVFMYACVILKVDDQLLPFRSDTAILRATLSTCDRYYTQRYTPGVGWSGAAGGQLWRRGTRPFQPAWSRDDQRSCNAHRFSQKSLITRCII